MPGFDEIVRLIPLAVGALKPGSPEGAAFMRGWQQTQLRMQQQGQQDRQIAGQDELRQAQIQNLQADNQRAEQDAARAEQDARLDRLLKGYTALQPQIQGAAETATDPIAAENQVLGQAQNLETALGLGPSSLSGFVPPMAPMVSNAKKRRAKARYQEFLTQYKERAAEAETSLSESSGEFAGMTFAQIREIAEAVQPPPAKPATESAGASDLDRSFVREKKAREVKLGRPLTPQEEADLDREVRTSLRTITAPGPRPVSRQQKFTMTRALQNDWRKMSAPAVEINRQLGVMRQGMAAMQRGDMSSATEAVVVTFEKILDPNSVVRESEFWRAAQGQSMLRRVETAMQRIKQGGYVTPATMEEFMRLAEDVAAATEAALAPTRQQLEQTAIEFELDPKMILTDVMTGEPAGGAGVLPPGVTVKKR